MRIVARLDVKNEYVIKGIHLEGLRKVGNPNELARRYYENGVDEVFFIDAVASLYDRNNLFPVIRAAAEDIFVPITVGGGIRSLADVAQALDAGADKVAINTAAVRNPSLISEVARQYGSQCVVASVQAKRQNDKWVVLVETGREPTGLLVLDWVRRLEELGAGELLLTSIDQEGTRTGFDIELAELVNEAVSIPVDISGGYGDPAHLTSLISRTRPSAIVLASVFHYNLASASDIRSIVESAEVI